MSTLHRKLREVDRDFSQPIAVRSKRLFSRVAIQERVVRPRRRKNGKRMGGPRPVRLRAPAPQLPAI